MKFSSSDDDENIKLYEKLLEKYGENYQSLDWGSQKSQFRRFEILADIGITKGDSVLDVGCGLSDFYTWLQDNIPGIKYYGIDITPSMIEKSSKKYPNIKFWKGSILDQDMKNQKFDFLFASGIFVFRKDNPISYMKKTIEKMFSLAIKGIAFNSLSTFASNKSLNEFYADPSEIFKFCKSIDKRVVLRHDYHKNDFTIYIHKEKKS